MPSPVQACSLAQSNQQESWFWIQKKDVRSVTVCSIFYWVRVPFDGTLLLGFVANLSAERNPLTVTGSCVCRHRSCRLCGLDGLWTMAPVQTTGSASGRHARLSGPKKRAQVPSVYTQKYTVDRHQSYRPGQARRKVSVLTWQNHRALAEEPRW